ncbi:MAG: leucine-rich repeat protein [Clostridia bacterium]|nr:leucine-rich repeat protein [Clostridia bacterium]
MAAKNTVATKKNTEEEYPLITTKFEAYTGNEEYLFVSYSHRDTEKVYKVLDALHDKKYRIWYDESCENGNDFRDELRQRIKGSSGILLFVSSASMASPFCGMEIVVAREYGKRLFPIYLEDEAVVPPAFAILLANTHHSTIENMDRLVKSMVRDLPAETMDRLTLHEGKLEKCEDNGQSIDVDEGVRLICAGAFKDRKQLKNIKLPESLEEIETEAFRGCGNLTSMCIPEKTHRIGESTFRDCVNMKSLVIKNDKIKIGERAFENCATLESVELPDGLTELYGGVFNSCKSIKAINLPSKLTIIGENAFSDCVGLEKVVVPDAVTKIDDLVFNGCISLASVVLPEGLRKIGKSAFKNCKALTNVTIPASVVSIADAPFRGCENMKSIRVEPKNKYYKSEPNKRDGSDYVLFNKNKSAIIAYPASSREVQYDIPDSVTVVSDWAFCDSKKLNRITMPDSVNEIGEGAFCNCTLLDEIEIPDSVIKIDDCAFRGCVSLDTVIIPDSVKDMGWGIFDGCEEKVVVYCNEGSYAQDYCRRNGIKDARIEDAYKE